MNKLLLILSLLLATCAQAQTVKEDTVKRIYYVNVEPVRWSDTEQELADRLYVYKGDEFTQVLFLKWEVGYLPAPDTWAHIQGTGAASLIGEDLETYRSLDNEPDRQLFIFNFVNSTLRTPLKIVE